MSRVLTKSLTHAYSKCENRHLCSINDHFFKTKAFCFKSISIGQTSIFTCFYQVPCVFMGSKFLRSHHRLCTPSDTFANFHRWIHMSNQEYRVFHPMGYLFLLAILNTRIFHFFFLLCNRETYFGSCPILPSPPSNTKHNVNLLGTHDIPSKNQTQCRSLPCTHTHVMRCPVHKCNVMSLHVSHSTCTMNATCNSSKSYFMPRIMDNHI